MEVISGGVNILGIGTIVVIAIVLGVVAFNIIRRFF